MCKHDVHCGTARQGLMEMVCDSSINVLIYRQLFIFSFTVTINTKNKNPIRINASFLFEFTTINIAPYTPMPINKFQVLVNINELISK